FNVIDDNIKYLESQLPKKPEIAGPRVFVGECGVKAKDVGFDPKRHEEVNREVFIKFLKTGVPYIIYWEMYNNEVKDGEQQGFFFINDKNEKQPLFYLLESLYQAQ